MADRGKESVQKMEHFLQAVEDLYPSTKQLIWRSFLRGIFMGLGTTVGVSIVLALLTFLVSLLAYNPVFRDIIESLKLRDYLKR
jgi:formate/nitrite transporter FocA (FNT family)